MSDDIENSPDKLKDQNMSVDALIKSDNSDGKKAENMAKFNKWLKEI